jgi:hypothetical protein
MVARGVSPFVACALARQLAAVLRRCGAPPGLPAATAAAGAARPLPPPLLAGRAWGAAARGVRAAAGGRSFAAFSAGGDSVGAAPPAAAPAPGEPPPLPSGVLAARERALARAVRMVTNRRGAARAQPQPKSAHIPQTAAVALPDVSAPARRMKSCAEVRLKLQEEEYTPDAVRARRGAAAAAAQAAERGCAHALLRRVRSRTRWRACAS